MEARPLRAGDRVVARWEPGRYFEGEILDVGATDVKIAWADGSTPSRVPLASVHAIAAGGAAPPEGAPVLARARTGTRWYGATVAHRRDDGTLKVRYHDGHEATLRAEQVIAVGEETRRDVLLADENAREVADPDEPRVVLPPGWRPTPGARVAAVWRKTTWYTGLVVSVDGDTVTVAWEDGSKPSFVPRRRVAPVPNGTGPSPPEGARVLLPPRTGAVWSFGRVVASMSRGCEVELEDGTRRPVPRGTCIVFAD